MTIDGLRVRYVVVSDREDVADSLPPLLICNGMGQSLGTMEPLVERLRGRRIILFDAPGAGLSDVPVVPMRIAHYSEMMKKLLDRLGYQCVDIMGVSWGGGPAQQFAYQYPDICRRLILAVSYCGGQMLNYRLDLMAEMGLPTRHFSKRRQNKVAPQLYGGDALNNPELVYEHYGRNRRPSLRGYYCQSIAIHCWTSLPWLHKLKQHTLVLSGEYDPLIPPVNQRLLTTRIPLATLKSYDCGHLLLFTRREQVSRDIEKFLA